MRGVNLLSPADLQAALAQRTCPETGGLLGSEGKPLKVQVGNRTVFVCCDGCIRDLQSAPSRYLADRR